MVISRRGASSLGCLLTLAIVAAIGYFGVNIGGVYWREYQFQDAMRQQVRFSSQATNDAIIADLRAMADTLDLPDEARKITVHRSQKAITVEARYDEHVELPFLKRDIHLHPHAASTP